MLAKKVNIVSDHASSHPRGFQWGLNRYLSLMSSRDAERRGKTSSWDRGSIPNWKPRGCEEAWPDTIVTQDELYLCIVIDFKSKVMLVFNPKVKYSDCWGADITQSVQQRCRAQLHNLECTGKVNQLPLNSNVFFTSTSIYNLMIL